MNSALPKIAAVIFTVGSIGMMGTSLAAYFNRLDYTSHMDDPVITDYKFNSSTSDGKTSWTVTPSIGDDRTEKRKDTGYAALQEAYTHKTSRLNAVTAQMTALQGQLIDQKSLVDTEQELDSVALNQRKQQLTSVVNSVEQKYLLLSQQHQELITESQSVRAETADRREDVIRLKSELEELRTDRYQLQELRRELTDRLIRLQLENQSIEQRLQQIRQQVK